MLGGKALPAVEDRRVFRATGREVPELAAVDQMVEEIIIKDEAAARGIVVEDTPDGPRWKRG